MIISTKRLELRLQTPQEVLAWVETLPEEVRCELSPDWLNRLKNSDTPDPWTCMFQIRLATDGSNVGSCGFKDRPDSSGMVELAYGIDEEHRQCGYASEAAAALAAYALTLPEVRIVRANTKPENAASQRVLIKCGFALIGQFEDPEDGTVNRWELQSEPNVTHSDALRSAPSPSINC